MSNSNIYNVIGVMSGTSIDGLDISLIQTDGKKYVNILFEKKSQTTYVLRAHCSIALFTSKLSLVYTPRPYFRAEDNEPSPYKPTPGLFLPKKCRT